MAALESFKLNRRQRKDYERILVRTIFNHDVNNKPLPEDRRYSFDQRKEAALHLAEIGQGFVPQTTFMEQIQSTDPADAEFNRWLMQQMTEGFRRGIADTGDENEDE